MNRRAIYPGSFDPVTYGHLDLIKRASKLFDEVVVAVANNTSKKKLFTAKERYEMIVEAAKDIKNVKIETFDGLVIEFARKKGINILLRGLRVISDFDYELQMALTNRRIDGRIETLFLMPSEGFSFLSSTLIKEAASLGGDISSFVPDFVAQKVFKKLRKATKS